MAKEPSNKPFKDTATKHHNVSQETRKPSGQYATRSRAGHAVPPPGPSNIIILTPNPLPAPKDVKSQ